MRASLESGGFCFNQEYHITATLHFFLGLVWLSFTGSFKIDRNVLQMGSRDIIKVALAWCTTIKKKFAHFVGLNCTHLATHRAHVTIIGCCQYLSLHLYECVIPGNAFLNYLALYGK